jgi:hypothetical protein
VFFNQAFEYFINRKRKCLTKFYICFEEHLEKLIGRTVIECEILPVLFFLLQSMDHSRVILSQRYHTINNYRHLYLQNNYENEGLAEKKP